MTRSSLIAAMLVCASGPVLAAPADEVMAAEQAINKAYAANDLKTYFSYYADDLRALFPDGPSSLAEYRRSWTKLIHDGGRVDHFRISGMVIQVSPAADSAVASYVADVKTTNPDGKPGDVGTFHETDVWFKRDGAWKIVETQYSHIVPGL